MAVDASLDGQLSDTCSSALRLIASRAENHFPTLRDASDKHRKVLSPKIVKECNDLYNCCTLLRHFTAPWATDFLKRLSDELEVAYCSSDLVLGGTVVPAESVTQYHDMTLGDRHTIDNSTQTRNSLKDDSSQTESANCLADFAVRTDLPTKFIYEPSDMIVEAADAAACSLHQGPMNSYSRISMMTADLPDCFPSLPDPLGGGVPPNSDEACLDRLPGLRHMAHDKVADLREAAGFFLDGFEQLDMDCITEASHSFPIDIDALSDSGADGGWTEVTRKEKKDKQDNNNMKEKGHNVRVLRGP